MNMGIKKIIRKLKCFIGWHNYEYLIQSNQFMDVVKCGECNKIENIMHL